MDMRFILPINCVRITFFVDKDNLIELRNKVIQFYQIASLIESGGLGLKDGVEKMKEVSKNMMDTVEKAIEDQSKINWKAHDPVFNSLYEPIEVDAETLSKIKYYLKLYEVNYLVEK